MVSMWTRVDVGQGPAAVRAPPSQASPTNPRPAKEASPMHGLLRIARRGALPALLGAACAHEAPFIPEDPNTFVPFADTEPARLTLSGFPDVGPVWLPDGESFIYSYTNIDSPERDRCLGVLSWNGGQRLREICRRTLADRDSIDVLDLPA